MAVAAEVVDAATVGTPALGPALSEAWQVQERHEGCFTGGKVVYCDASHSICCLCSEELHLVDAEAQEATRRISHEGDGILTYAIDHLGQNACTSHRSGLLRHFKLSSPSPELVRSWKAHDQIVADVAFDATGSVVASGSVDRTVKVWDFAGYFCTHNFRGHSAIVTIVRFHPAKLQVVSIADAEVRLWDLQTSTCVGIMKDHLASISSVCFAKAKGGTHRLVTGGRDQIVNLWQLEEKCALIKSVPVFENVEGVAVIPISKAKPLLPKGTELPAFLLATVGDKCQLRLWNPLDGRCVTTRLSPHAAKGVFRQVHTLEQAGGCKLMTIGDDLNLIFWSLPDLRVTNHIMGQNEEIVHVQLIPQFTLDDSSAAGEGTGTRKAVATADRFVCIANDEHPRIVNCHGFGATLLRGHTDVVISCDVSVDGRWVATGGKDQSVRVWDVSEGICVCKVAGHAGAVSALSFPKRLPKGGVNSPAALIQDKQPLTIVSGSHDKTMKIWELPSPSKLLEVAKADDETGKKELFVETSKVTVVAHAKEVNDVVVSPNNKLIASGGHDKLVRIWQYPSGDLLGECKGHRRAVWHVAFSPVDQVIASASGDASVRLWNLKDYTAIRSFQGHGSAVLRCCFLAEGMQLMTSSVDGLLKLWQIRTADCAATFEEHVGKVWCIDIVGNRMVSGGSDSKLCVWKDVTSDRVKERHDAKADEVMKDSKIGLLLRNGKIEEALTLALELNRPGLMKQILQDHAMKVVGKCVEKAPDMADDDQEECSVDLRRWILSLKGDRLTQFVELLEQWNSNRKMASLAQMLMGLVLQTTPPSKLVAIEGMNSTCANFLSYGSRHMARVDSLLQKTFLFDLVLQSGARGLAIQSDLEEKNTNNAEDALKRTMDVLLGEGEEDEDDVEDDHDALLGASDTNGNVGTALASNDVAKENGKHANPRKRRKSS